MEDMRIPQQACWIVRMILCAGVRLPLISIGRHIEGNLNKQTYLQLLARACRLMTYTTCANITRDESISLQTAPSRDNYDLKSPFGYKSQLQVP